MRRHVAEEKALQSRLQVVETGLLLDRVMATRRNSFVSVTDLTTSSHEVCSDALSICGSSLLRIRSRWHQAYTKGSLPWPAGLAMALGRWVLHILLFLPALGSANPDLHYRAVTTCGSGALLGKEEQLSSWSVYAQLQTALFQGKPELAIVARGCS